MLNIPFKKINYLPFTVDKFSVLKPLEDNSLIIAFFLSFSFFILVILSYLWKRRLYNKKGYLQIEKEELKYLLEDIKKRQYNSSKKCNKQKRLLTLLTENDNPSYQNNSKAIKANIYDQNYQNLGKKQQKGQLNSSLHQGSTSNTENIITSNKKSIQMQNFQQINQQQNSLNNNQGNINQSRDGLFNKDDINYSSLDISKNISALQSATSNNITNNFIINNNQNNENDIENNPKQHYFSRRGSSALNSFASIPKNLLLQSTVDSTSITPCSLTSSFIQPLNQNQKHIESFSSLVVAQDQKSTNSNKSIFNNNNNKILTSQNQQNSTNNYNSQNNKLPNTNQNNLFKTKTDKYSQKLDRKIRQQMKDQNKKKQNQMNEYEENDQQVNGQNDVDFSFDRIIEIKESTFVQRFIKSWMMLFVRHNIIWNTIKQDTILFSRALKIQIINIFINLQLLSGTFIQIYFYNLQVMKIEQKYKNRDDHTVYKEKIIPNNDQNQFKNEIGYSVFISLLSLLFMMVFTFISKADKDMLFINMNNHQLLKNLQEIQNGQSYKLFVGLLVNFSLSSICFLQYSSFIQRISEEFILRWFYINSLIIILTIILFDFIYLTILALLKAASKKSARCQTIHQYMIKKLSWWSI